MFDPGTLDLCTTSPKAVPRNILWETSPDFSLERSVAFPLCLDQERGHPAAGAKTVSPGLGKFPLPPSLPSLIEGTTSLNPLHGASSGATCYDECAQHQVFGSFRGFSSTAFQQWHREVLLRLTEGRSESFSGAAQATVCS